MKYVLNSSNLSRDIPRVFLFASTEHQHDQFLGLAKFGGKMGLSLHQSWDGVAESLNNIPPSEERVRYAVAIKPLLPLPKNANILEVGCGSGRVLRALTRLGYNHLTGLEISQARLNEVNRLGASDTDLVCSNKIPFTNNMFDGVVCSAVIEHIINPSNWLSELARVTQSGGVVSIVTDTYIWYWLRKLGLYQTIQPLDEAIWPEVLIQWGQQAGLKLISCNGFYNTPDQRNYLGKKLLSLPHIYLGQLLRSVLSPTVWSKLRPTHISSPVPEIPIDTDTEAELILKAVENFNHHANISRWNCVWSYECYYWFRKC